MILQALTKLYDALLEKDILKLPGWQRVNVSYALEIGADGELLRVISLLVPVVRGKKEVFVPQTMNLPALVKRASGIASNFLCDNCTYIFGVSGKGNDERAVNCHRECAALHRVILGNIDHPAAKAVIRYFDKWSPTAFDGHPALEGFREKLLTGANIVFWFDGGYVHDIPVIKDAWTASYQDDSDSVEMRCLVTGERGAVARLHPSIKGAGGSAFGTSLVSFNTDASESFGRNKSQGENAPVSRRAAFAYGEALNYLLSGVRHRQKLGDTTLVYWAEDAAIEYSDCFDAMQGGNSEVTDNDVADVMRKLASGQSASWNDLPLDPANHFYVLGLSPSSARLSVRFFLCDSFGGFAKHLQAHADRLEIERPKFVERAGLSVWTLLDETVNRKSRDKAPVPQLVGELLRAILMDSAYPATLYNQVELRIRAERVISYGRAAIIKAYMLKNLSRSAKFNEYKGALDVILNEDTNYQPYLMGRLFSVLEGLQQAANPDINATIRDKFFNAACSTPTVVFPLILRLAQAYLKKLKVGSRIFYEKQLTDIMGRMDSSYPSRLSLEDQGIFQLGYYHQTQKRFEKKEDKKDA